MVLAKILKGYPFGRVLQFLSVLFCQVGALRLMIGIQLLALRFMPLKEFRPRERFLRGSPDRPSLTRGHFRRFRP
jgi:hypothetical protein